MIFSNKETLEDIIVKKLLEKPSTAKGLDRLLVKELGPLTLQGVYKILKNLVNKEVLIKNSNLYSLSEEWRNRALEGLEKNNNKFELTEGESIRLDLESLVHLDQQWKNIVLPLQNAHPEIPPFFYNPHEIWIHLSDSRKESEEKYYNSFQENKSYGFFIIGGNTLHDQEMKKKIQNDYLRVSLGKKYFAISDYPAILGDYVITTRLSKRLSEEIEDCYQTSKDIEILEFKLKRIGIERKKVKLIIERNREKAKKLRKKMSADFHIPRELVEKFDLF